MSVLIKGMDMPKDCNECPLTYLSGGLRICQFACLKNDGCPLVEVKTPHGDLVDRNELTIEYIEDVFGRYCEINAPTVIEAEE